jgi:hypothetical protein
MAKNQGLKSTSFGNKIRKQIKRDFGQKERKRGDQGRDNN